MDLDNCKQMSTPGVKKAFTEDVMDLPISDDSDGINSLNARMTQVTLDESNVEVHNVISYSKVYGCHPSGFVFDRMGAC